MAEPAAAHRRLYRMGFSATERLRIGNENRAYQKVADAQEK